MFHIGTAGWTIPRLSPPEFSGDASHLTRYATHLNAVEINSTFYRPHRPATFARWAATVPSNFRFSVKAPRAITHEGKLHRTGAPLQAFIDMVSHLGDNLGPLLFQLPPKLAFDDGLAEDFLTTLRELHPGPVVLEPRHPTWFTPAAAALLRRHEIARVAADPARVPEAAHPGAWPGLRYFRLHGSPRTYWTRYEPPFLERIAQSMQSHPTPSWCIFDNTASGAAIFNATELRNLIKHPSAKLEPSANLEP